MRLEGVEKLKGIFLMRMMLRSGNRKAANIRQVFFEQISTWQELSILGPDEDSSGLPNLRKS